MTDNPQHDNESQGGPIAAAEWDAGDLGCGDLVLELRTRLMGIEPAAILKVRATDPGAPEDLPAWARLTGNKIVQASHPFYWIQRKPNS
jgi:tRNA 2-thiouridine synthesizing protein A